MSFVNHKGPLSNQEQDLFRLLALTLCTEYIMYAYIKNILELYLYDFSLHSEGQFPSFWLCVIYILLLKCK